jgi:hypothetical protein
VGVVEPPPPGKGFAATCSLNVFEGLEGKKKKKNFLKKENFLKMVDFSFGWRKKKLTPNRPAFL